MKAQVGAKGVGIRVPVSTLLKIDNLPIIIVCLQMSRCIPFSPWGREEQERWTTLERHRVMSRPGQRPTCPGHGRDGVLLPWMLHQSMAILVAVLRQDDNILDNVCKPTAANMDNLCETVQLGALQSNILRRGKIGQG